MERMAIYSFLARYRYGVVASLSSDGIPQSALVGIATTEDLEIVFDTLRSSRKYKNLIERPVCSFVVGWGGERTVQFEGIATELKGAELKRYQATYFATWPDWPERNSLPDITYFVVRPRWIRYSEYEHRTPLIVEIEFADDPP